MNRVSAFRTVRDMQDAERRRMNHRLVFVAILFLLGGIVLGYATGSYYAAQCVAERGVR